MQTPTTAQLRTAVEVLNKLGELLNTHAEHSVMQLSDARLGENIPRASNRKQSRKSLA